MKISVNWLKEFIDIDLSPQKIIEELDRIGLLVDSWKKRSSDVILDIETYANRPDTLGHLGLARELSVALNIPLKERNWPLTETESDVSGQVSIEIRDEDLCPRYCGMVVHDVKVGPSPDWLKEKIEAMGLKPINTVVDVSNWVLFATGHPIHIFDLSKIAGREVIIRKARKDEKFKTLEGDTLSLSPEMLVIADEEKAIALAGVIGGENSAVSDKTRDVFIESACFDPVSIRNTSKKTGIQTDASYRFERGADLSYPPHAALMVASLLTQQGGKAARGKLDVYPQQRKNRIVVLRHHRIAKLLGVEIEAELVTQILSRLGFRVEKNQEGIWQVKVPFFRVDIEREADLVEEIARFYGYNRIPALIPPLVKLEPPMDRKRGFIRKLRQLLFHYGFDEVLNFSFSDPEKEQEFETGLMPIGIRNPISSKASILRTTLFGGLLENIAWNQNREAEGVHVFEIGNIYYWENEASRERLTLGLATSGSLGALHWLADREETGLYHMKGACEAVLQGLGYNSFSFAKEDHPQFEKGESLSIGFKGEKVGKVGLLRKEILLAFLVKKNVWAAEIDLGMMFERQPEAFLFSPVAKYPGISRDVSFVADQNVAYQEIKEAIEKLSLPYLEKFELYDRFSGAPLPKGKVSLSIRFLFRHPQKTLQAEEADSLQKRIIKALKAQFKFQLREGGEN